MSRTQEREYRGWVARAPQPPQADARDDERDPDAQPGAWPGLWPVAVLVLMSFVLLAGYWKPYPIPSLVVPVLGFVAWRGAIRAKRVERWLFFYLAGLYVYTVLRALADEFGFPIQVDYTIAVDKLLFGGAVPSVELQGGWFSPGSVNWLDLLTTAVHVSFFIVPHAAAVFIWRRHPGALPAYVAAVLLTLYAALLLFFLVPTVPPWLAARQGELRGTYRVLDFVLRGVDDATYQQLYKSLGEPNSVAAMPSIHMAITCVVLLRVRNLMPRWTWPLGIYTVLMGFSLVYLGEHYVFDVLVGALIAVGAHYALSSRWAPEGMRTSVSSPPEPRAAA